MGASAKDGREGVFLGHPVEVYPSDDHRWGGEVDGREFPARLDGSDAADEGVESHRRSRVVGSPFVRH